MKNIESILTEAGITIPDDKKEAFNKAFHENYKTISEVQKIERDRDKFKADFENAADTLKKFDGKDIDAIIKERDDWKQKFDQSEQDHAKKEADRLFEEALTEQMKTVKFTSESAKKSVLADVKGLVSFKDGQLYGFSDAIAKVKETDASAFVDEKQEELEGKKAKFSKKDSEGGAGTLSKADIMKITDRDERRKAIADNWKLFS